MNRLDKVTDSECSLSALRAELRNPWAQMDGVERGKIPDWCCALLMRAADALETSQPLPRPQFHEVLKLMRETMESHPFWRKVDGTPAANDLPVRAAVVAMELLITHDTLSRGAIEKIVANYQISVGLDDESAWEDAHGIAEALTAATPTPTEKGEKL